MQLSRRAAHIGPMLILISNLLRHAADYMIFIQKIINNSNATTVYRKELDVKIAIKKICVPLALCAIFFLAGMIGLACEHWHNDLALSTTAFLTSFGSMAGLVFRVYNAVA